MSSSSFDNVELSDARHRGSNCPEPCAVCGDSSTGYHYDVPSCNGCKTFFRRTIISNRKFECHRDGKCQFDKDVRCACRACRFRRCVEVGMNPKAIQYAPTAVELGKKGKSIKTVLVSDAPPLNEQQIFQLQPQPSLDLTDSSTDPVVKRLMDTELKCEYLRTSNFPAGNSLLDLLTRPCALDDITIYTTLTSWSWTEGNPMERMRHWLQLDLTILIEYAKSFDTFMNLSLTDKCALLQQVSMVCCGIISHYDSVRKGYDVLVFPCGMVPSREMPFALARGRTPHDRLMQVFLRHKFDRTEYVLMKAILFFYSDCWELSEDGKKHIGVERQKCLDALFKHLCAEYGPAGPGRFGMNLVVLPTICDTGEKVKDRMRVGEILRQKNMEPFIQEMILGKKIML